MKRTSFLQMQEAVSTANLRLFGIHQAEPITPTKNRRLSVVLSKKCFVVQVVTFKQGQRTDIRSVVETPSLEETIAVLGTLQSKDLNN